MPSVADYLGFAYPFLVDPGDDRYVAGDDLALAVGIAELQRPLVACLVPEMQNLAVAHYTAYLLSSRLAAPDLYGTVSNAASQNVAGPVVERQEGDVRVRYSEGAKSSSSSASRSSGGGDAGPAAPYAAFLALAARCGVVPGTGNPTDPAQQPRYRGGIITRYGSG